MRNLIVEDWQLSIDNSEMSLVTRVAEQTSGASMMRVDSSERLTVTEGKGVYQSEASGPERRRRAM